MTPEELALLCLAPGDPLPVGGQTLEAEVCSGARASRDSLSHGPYSQTFRECYGVTFHSGTLNLRAASPVKWDSPRQIGTTHEFCPIILQERAVGVVLRWADGEHQPPPPTFLEVLSPIALHPRLGNVQDGQTISVRLLSGDVLTGVTG